MPPVDISHQIDMCVHANDSTANRSVPLGGIVNNPRKLTAEVILAYISCKYKAYLMLSGTFQAPGPYEEWFRVQDVEYRSRCIRAINDRTNKSLPSCNRSHPPLHRLSEGSRLPSERRAERLR